MDQETTLTNADWRLMDIVWDYEVVDSPQLLPPCGGEARLEAHDHLIRCSYVLCEKGYLINDASRVTSLVARTEAGRREGDQLVSRGFKGSLPLYIAAVYRRGILG
jgi:hypothetical protein